MAWRLNYIMWLKKKIKIWEIEVWIIKWEINNPKRKSRVFSISWGRAADDIDFHDNRKSRNIVVSELRGESVRMDEENVKNIQKFLVAQLNFTPRRKMFEDHLLEKESEKLGKFEILDDDDDDADEDSKFMETTEPCEQRNQWKLIKQLRDFRRSHIKECVNPLNRQKYMRAEQRDEEFLITSHRISGPPSTEELINLIETDKKKESIRARFNACKFRQ